ncbi:YifB family Mg chelatase-like AAA ATPase [Scopulibacillus cellulosilyticus]|uniref:YifB family Mg chelatase-like AAA ATPase n=1 Tax=Scopulibacillus cellulosilyticus TaxID=2665665 RepID=A0ABW2PY08_9BACL
MKIIASIVYSFGISGVDGYLVEVEADMIYGDKHVSIVGLGDAAVKEAKDRLESAVTSCGYNFPQGRFVINLAPSHIKKGGSHFDVAMACALLLRTNQIKTSLQSFALIGELSLNGNIRPCSGILPMALAAKQAGISHLIVPSKNAGEARLVKDIKIISCENLHDVVKALSGELFIDNTCYQSPKRDILTPIDFSDVKGQETLIEYMTVAAAGGHNLLMIGPPGCGKSMIAQRIPTILPPMTEDEALEVTKIYSVANLLKSGGLIQERPFRSPHHNISTNALIGGGKYSMPGEISFAHDGVLFLDEIAEFSRKTLESLRQPLEDRKVTIGRVQSTNTFPANFMLIAAMNPCPCGYFGLENCRCTDYEIIRYRQKLSGPLIDRIDIQKYIKAVNFFEVNKEGPSSSFLREKVSNARLIQQKSIVKSILLVMQN